MATSPASTTDQRDRPARLSGLVPVRFRSPGLVLAGAVLSLLLVFRVQVATGFALVTGDIYDGRIEISLLLHWFNVLRGLEHWNSTAYFWPHVDTLGYNDGYLLFGLVFSLFRMFGVEPMLASDLVNLVVRLVGYGAFVAMAMELCGLPLLWAVLGAVLFTVSNGMYVQEVHAQLLTVCFVPLLGWLLARAWRCLPLRPARAAAFGSTAAALYGAWLLTGFYMAWFTAFFCTLWLAALLVLSLPDRSRLEPLRRLLCWPVALSACVLLLCSLPFLLVYLPTAAQTGQHPFYLAREGLPTPRDLLRVGPGNLLFGWFDPVLNNGVGGANAAGSVGEPIIGYPPLLWLAALGGTALLFRRVGGAPVPADRTAWRAMAIAVLASILSCLDILGGAAWHVVYRLLPGAAALRTETRFLLFLDIPVVLLAMLAMRWLAARVRWPVLAGLAALLLAGELTTQDSQALDRAEERAVADAVPQADPDCGAFFVASRGFQAANSTVPMDRLYHHTVDAMMLAEQRVLPTLNGFATFLPPDVAAINRLPVAQATIDDFMRRYRITTRVCALDLDRGRWLRTPPRRAPALPADGLRFAGPDADAEPFLGPGWSHGEADGRWTDGGRAVLEMTVPEDFSGRALALQVQALPFFPPGRPASPVRVLANGQLVQRWLPRPGQQRFDAVIPPDLPGLPALTLEFLVSKPMSPRRTDGTPDDRALGLRFRSVSLQPVADKVRAPP